jgi:CRISPR-associated endonuclease Csn1
VTDFLRHIWGYDEILHQLNLAKYRDAEMTEIVTYDHRGQEHQEERIKNWSKRIDHRHHAIDALTIALTKQGYIQRLNSLSASHDEIEAAVREKNPVMDRKYSLLEKYIYIQPHFTVQEVTDAVDGILVSFRAGKKVTTPAKRAKYHNGKRMIVQDGLLVPRGALTEETVYGKLGDKYVVKYALNHPSMKVDEIVDPTIREIVRARLAAFGGKAKDAFAKPLYSDAAQTMEIKSVRCYTGLQDRAVAAVRYNEQGEAVGYAKTGNNHHIAIYQDANGQYQELVVSFWQAVERKRYGLPIVIEDPKAVWDRVMDMDLPQAFLETLPKDDWQFVVSLQANEMFILGLEDGDFEMAMENKDYQLLNKHLYRVQKIGSKDYSFRHHIETSVDDKYDGVTNIALSLSMKKLLRLRSFGSWFAQYPHKVRVNLLGEIAEV